jgi:serpin B
MALAVTWAAAQRLIDVNRRLAGILGFVLIATACAPSTGSPSPSPSAEPSATASASATASPTAGPPAAIGLAIADVPRAAATSEDAKAAAAAINDFGLELFHAAVKPGENGVVSPASIAIALAMARAGARGETAAQMDAVLRSVAADENAAWLNALDQALTNRSGTFKDMAGKDVDVALRIANAPFAQQGMALEAAYLEALAARFGAGVRLVDYTSDAEGARQAINAWVSDQTEARIPELLARNTVSGATRLVLVNAIYLKAAWLMPFVVEATTPGPFTRLDGSTVDVPMMAASERLPYAEGAGWRAVELPYVGGSLAMTVIVPDDLAAFEASLDGAAFDAIVASLASSSVDLAFPKFGIETRAELNDVLKALGMPLAFDPSGADFSGITNEEALFIAWVIHQANIDVDEKGTEAAAATAVGMEGSAGPTEPIEMRVDRPFLFALRDKPTGAILFLGRVTEPVVR